MTLCIPRFDIAVPMSLTLLLERVCQICLWTHCSCSAKTVNGSAKCTMTFFEFILIVKKKKAAAVS